MTGGDTSNYAALAPDQISAFTGLKPEVRIAWEGL